MKPLCFPAPVIALTLLVACAPPKRDFDDEQIKSVADFDELMWVQATVADPRFELAEKSTRESLTKEHLEAFRDMGHRLRIAARRMPAFREELMVDDGFVRFAQQQQEKAEMLEMAAQAGDRKVVLDLALSIRTTCAACHVAYR